MLDIECYTKTCETCICYIRECLVCERCEKHIRELIEIATIGHIDVG